MRLLLLLIVSTILTSCSIKKSDKDIYIESLQSSIYPDSSKIDTNLVQINDENKNLIRKNIAGEEYILVVTLKQNISYYKDTFNTGNYPIWVTTSPEYAQMHLEKYLKNKGRIIHERVNGQDVLVSPTGNAEEAIFAPRQYSASRLLPIPAGLWGIGAMQDKDTN
jgi:hypothetical protein